MTQQHFIGEVGQKAVIEKDGKVLLCRGVGSTTWDLPGGRLNKGEEPHAGLTREVLEELGVNVTIGDPFFVCAVHDFKNQPPRYFVVFTATLIDEAVELTLATDEITEVRFVGMEDIASVPMPNEWRRALAVYFLRQSTVGQD